MEHWKKNLFLVWISQLLSLSGFSAAIPFIPLYIKERLQVTDEGTCGVYVSLFYFFGMLSFAVAAPIWGKLADRYGRRMMLLRATFVTAFIIPWMMFADNIVTLILIRVLSSGFSGTVNAAQTLVSSGTPEEYQGFALGTVSSAVWSGTMFGYFFGGLIVHQWGFNAAFASCGAMFFLAGIIALFIEEKFVPVPAEKSPKRRNVRNFRIPVIPLQLRWLLLLFFTFGLLRNFENPYLAMKIEFISLPGDAAKNTGVISAIAAFAGILSGMLMGTLADRFPARKILLPALLASGGMLLLQGAAGSLFLLGGARFFAYLGAGGIDPILQRLMAKITPPEKRGSVFGLSASARTCGLMASALVSGTIIYFFGTISVFIVGGILFLFLAFPAAHIVNNIERKAQ